MRLGSANSWSVGARDVCCASHLCGTSNLPRCGHQRHAFRRLKAVPSTLWINREHPGAESEGLGPQRISRVERRPESRTRCRAITTSRNTSQLISTARDCGGEGIDWIRKGQALPRNTATFAFNRDPDKVGHAHRIKADSDLHGSQGRSGSICVRTSSDLVATGKHSPCFTALSSPTVRTRTMMRG